MADLSGADLRAIYAPGGSFLGVNLESARLPDATLWTANFQKARMKQADLTGASLKSARLEEVDLEGATLTGVELPHSTSTTGWLRATCPDGARVTEPDQNCNAHRLPPRRRPPKK